MRNYIIISAVIGSLLFSSCASNSEPFDGYTINGELKGLGNTPIRFSYHDTLDHTKWLNDTIYPKNDKFLIKGKVKEEDWAYIYILDTTLHIYDNTGQQRYQSKVASLYLTNGPITINGRYDEANVAEITGNEFNTGISKYMQTIDQLSREESELLRKLVGTENKDEREALITQQRRLYAEMNNKAYRFMKDEINEPYAAYMLRKRMYRMTTDSIEQFYSAFTDSVKQSKYGKIIGERLDAAKKTALGELAVDFELPDVNDKMIRLSDLRGKVVLLDFWGSWCAPCRKAHPHLREVYDKYKDKGFEIVGIAQDKNPELWKKAIKKDQLTWLQINGSTHIDKINLFTQYSVNAFPTKILIDKDGKIVYRTVSGKLDSTAELEEKLAKLLGS